MRYPKRLKKTGKPGQIRGIRLKHNRKFEPVIATSANTKVRSRYEKACAEYLDHCGIEFQYEPLMLIGGAKFRPDFYLPEYDLFLEICGFDHMPYYRDRTKTKRELYEKAGMKTAFVHCPSLQSVIPALKTALRENGIDIEHHQH